MYDIRLDHEDNPFILEVNLCCSFGMQSVLVAHAQEIGMTDQELFKIMAKNALNRKR